VLQIVIFGLHAILAQGVAQSATCHCAPTGRANARPMTGSAKQS